MTRNAYVLVGDSAYLDKCIFAAKRLRASGALQDIIIFSDAVRDDDFQNNIAFRTINVDYSMLPRNCLGEYAYWRIPSIGHASKDYAKVAYLDSDFYALSKNIDAVFDLNLRDRPLGAAYDFFEWLRPWLRPREFRRSGLNSARYFNSGFLLVDCQKWLAGNFEEKCFQFAADVPQAVSRSDQSLLNMAFADQWTEISPAWNWQYTTKAHALLNLNQVKFLHFCGPDKPWRDPHHRLPVRVTSEWTAFETSRELVGSSNMPIKRPRPDAKSLAYSIQMYRLRRRFAHAAVTF